MNRQIENGFIECYIVKNKRERLAHELFGKKRMDGVGRFCHCADEFLVASKIKAKGQYITDELYKRIPKNKKCYVISCAEDLDGKEFDGGEILNLILGRGMPSIAVFEDFAIIETEQEQGPAVKYLLEA